LSGELTVALKKGLRKKAKKALREKSAIERLRKSAKNGEEVKQLDEVVEHLEEVAGQEAKRIFKNIDGIEFEILPLNLLKKYTNNAIKKAAKKGVKLEIKWIDASHPNFLNRKLLGKFQITLDKKKVIMHLRPECPKITFYHENWHLDDFLEKGWKEYVNISKIKPWLHEESVWLRVLNNRNKWREPELVDAYEYYKWYCVEKHKARYKINMEIEKLLPKYKHLLN